MSVILIKPDTACQMLGVSSETLKAWRHRGIGPRYVRVGRCVRYAPEDLDAWRREQTVDPAERTA